MHGGNDNDDIFASPKSKRKHGAQNGGPHSSGKNKKKNKKSKTEAVTPGVATPTQSSSGGGDFRSLVSNLPVSSFSGTINVTKKEPSKQKVSPESPQSNSGGYQSLVSSLPVASFSTMGTNTNGINKEQKPKVSSEDADSSNSGGYRSLVSSLPVASFSTMSNNGIKKEQVSSPEPTNTQENQSSTGKKKKKKKKQILPNSNEAGKKWVNVVVKTREHPRYANAFDFAQYKEKSKEMGLTAEWVKAKPYGKWCSKNPQVIAIDCEMCETIDPVSGAKNAKALCRLSVVNAERPEEVLLDTLVKPSWPVSDYRTRINGISEEHLKGVQFTLRHAQSYMMSLCSEETVIVGHAVHNDLAALFMEHHCIADSSYLFRAKDNPDASVSLKDLVSTIFHEKMPETHDSVNDSRKALECVRHWIKNDGNVVEIERSTLHARGTQLFVHRIPKQCKPQHFLTLFKEHTGVVPHKVDEIEFNGDTGKTHVQFRSLEHANLAFDTLEGSAEPDKGGRLQKKVYLKDKSYVRIRKMVYERPDTSESAEE